MSLRLQRRPAFTIVELLVVIGVIGLLIGLLAPALSGVQKRSLKATEMNDIRTVGQAWTMYANNNDDKTPPGYIEPEVQADWRLSPLFPDRTPIPPIAAAPWTWRLMTYVGDNAPLIHGYIHEDDAMLDLIGEAGDVALTPAFGYNAYYVGGWWEMTTMPDGDVRPQPKFWDATVDGRSENVIVRSIGQIRRSSELLIFCSAALRDPGVYRRTERDEPGSHFVSAPFLGPVEQWGLVGSASTGGGGGGGGVGRDISASQVGGDVSTVEVFTQTATPIGRHTGQTAIVYGDGHTGVTAPGTLVDQRAFIDVANKRDFKHGP